MSTPSQRAPFQSEHSLRFSAHRTSLRMRILGIISQIFVVDFFPPGILPALLPLPVHRSLVASFVAVDSPPPRPRKSFALKIGPFFRWLRRRKRRRSSPVLRHDGQHYARTIAPAEFQGSRH